MSVFPWPPRFPDQAPSRFQPWAHMWRPAMQIFTLLSLRAAQINWLLSSSCIRIIWAPWNVCGKSINHQPKTNAMGNIIIPTWQGEMYCFSTHILKNQWNLKKVNQSKKIGGTQKKDWACIHGKSAVRPLKKPRFEKTLPHHQSFYVASWPARPLQWCKLPGQSRNSSSKNGVEKPPKPSVNSFGKVLSTQLYRKGVYKQYIT